MSLFGFCDMFSWTRFLHGLVRHRGKAQQEVIVGQDSLWDSSLYISVHATNKIPSFEARRKPVSAPITRKALRVFA
jgi:hypothetical protein